jgi:hypothetical protein
MFLGRYAADFLDGERVGGTGQIVEDKGQIDEQKTAKAEPLPVELYIAPWALPNEPVPVHVKWHDEFNFESVKIVLPAEWTFVDVASKREIPHRDHFAGLIPESSSIDRMITALSLVES